MKEYYVRNRSPVPKKLKDLLHSVKNFKGEYEYERDYLKVLNKLKDTSPFSMLIFYERPKKKVKNRVLKEKNYFMPERMLFGVAMYEQFYLVPELEELRVGNYLGSGYRSTQSVYALSLAILSNEKKIPTHLLVLDKQNNMKHILSSSKLIVQPHEVIQNVEKTLVDKILKNTIKASGLFYGDSLDSVYLQEH